MIVRFLPEYCADKNNRICYELVSDDMELEWDEGNEHWEECFNTKLLGFVACYKMEEADGTELPAIDIYLKSL